MRKCSPTLSSLASTRPRRASATNELSTLGGGRWMETAVGEARGARAIDVDGLELMITVPSPTYGETVNVFNAVNFLQTDQLDDDRLYPALAAPVSEL